MSKKKVIQAPAIIQRAEVSNNINLNLNQNDLIDLAIQEHLEMLEGKIKVVKEEMAQITKTTDQLRKEAAKDIARKVLKKESDYTKLIELFAVLEVNDIEGANNDKYINYSPYKLYSRTSQDDYLGEFSYYNQDEYTSLSQATRGVCVGRWYKNAFTQVDVNLRYNDNGLSLSYHKSLMLNPKDTKELCKVLEPLDSRLYELHKLKFDLQKEFFEYTFGEKRVKAKIVKASLKKTAEGQAILGMLQGATGVKLIG